jgi:hypothetical protein
MCFSVTPGDSVVVIGNSACILYSSGEGRRRRRKRTRKMEVIGSMGAFNWVTYVRLVRLDDCTSGHLYIPILMVLEGSPVMVV